MRLHHVFGLIVASTLLAGGIYSQSVTGVPSSNTGIPIPGTTSAGLAPVVPATADVLDCGATPNIDTTPVAFATTWTMPSFTQTKGASYQIFADLLWTSSAVPVSMTLSINIDGNAAFTSISGTNSGSSVSAAATGFTSDFVLAAPGSSGSIYAITTVNYANSQISKNAISSPFSLNTITSHTVSFLYQCSLATAGNSVQLVALRPMRVW